MSFSRDLDAFMRRVEIRLRDVYTGVAEEVHRSVVEGSEITGAPGQPVDTSYLRNSWQLAIGPREAVISTNVDYAPGIEDGVGPNGPIQLRSPVGGFHSVKLTRAGFPRIVDHVVRKEAR